LPYSDGDVASFAWVPRGDVNVSSFLAHTSFVVLRRDLLEVMLE